MTDTISFQNALLIDGTGGDPKLATTLVVSNSTIPKVIPDGERVTLSKGRELALKAQVMTPMEAIVSTTRTNAEIDRMSDLSSLFIPQKSHGYKGKRLFLTKVREEQVTELLQSLRRRRYFDEKDEAWFLVFFQIDKELPLIGSGK